MKVGEYVRTKDGRIDKIESIHNGLYILENFPYGYNEQLLIKSSSNIIDLIEVGDYVNGMIVHCVYAEEDEIVVGGLDVLIQDTLVTLRSNSIKTIVTKEQFSQMEYRIGE